MFHFLIPHFLFQERFLLILIIWDPAGLGSEAARETQAERHFPHKDRTGQKPERRAENERLAGQGVTFASAQKGRQRKLSQGKRSFPCAAQAANVWG